MFVDGLGIAVEGIGKLLADDFGNVGFAFFRKGLPYFPLRFYPDQKMEVVPQKTIGIYGCNRRDFTAYQGKEIVVILIIEE